MASTFADQEAVVAFLSGHVAWLVLNGGRQP
jgi:hypothetical protein